MDFNLDMDKIDSSYTHFFNTTRKRFGKTISTKGDSIAANRDFQAMKSHFEKAYILFNSDSSFVSNFFSDQEDFLKGIYIYAPLTHEIFLKIGDRLLNYNITTISTFSPTSLSFVCLLDHCDIIYVLFKRE